MSGAERRGLPYLFRLRLTANVKKPIKKTFSKDDWTDAGQGWRGREDVPRLEGWSRQRWAVIPRRRLKGGVAAAGRDDSGQLALSFVEIGPDAVPCRRHRCRGSRPANSPHVPPYARAARPRPHRQAQELSPLPHRPSRIQSHGVRRAFQKSRLSQPLPRPAGRPCLTRGLKLPLSCQVLGRNCITLLPARHPGFPPLLAFAL